MADPLHHVRRMVASLILLGMVGKLGLSSMVVYRTRLWWAPSAGLIGMGFVLGFMTHRMALGAASISLGVPAMYLTHRLHQRWHRGIRA
jgi:hypothetical protein